MLQRAIDRAMNLLGGRRLPRMVRMHAGGRRIRFEATTPTELSRVLGVGGERDFLERTLAYVEPGTTFLDAGTCIGLYSLSAAACGARVYSIEPDLGFQARLTRNLELNGFTDRVTLLPCALGGAPGRLTLHTGGIDGMSPSLREVQPLNTQRVTVDVDTLDGLVARGACATPDVVKIDIEGAEYDALQGMLQMMASPRRPHRVCMEVHPLFLPYFNATADDVYRLMAEYGYTAEFELKRADQHQVIFKDSWA